MRHVRMGSAAPSTSVAQPRRRRTMPPRHMPMPQPHHCIDMREPPSTHLPIKGAKLAPVCVSSLPPACGARHGRSHRAHLAACFLSRTTTQVPPIGSLEAPHAVFSHSPVDSSSEPLLPRAPPGSVIPACRRPFRPNSGHGPIPCALVATPNRSFGQECR
jgi:hypothetical protein